MKKACLSCIVALLLFAAFGCGLKTTTTAPDPLPFDYGTVLTPIDLPARVRIEPAQVPTLGSHPGGHILTNA